MIFYILGANKLVLKFFVIIEIYKIKEFVDHGLSNIRLTAYFRKNIQKRLFKFFHFLLRDTDANFVLGVLFLFLFAFNLYDCFYIFLSLQKVFKWNIKNFRQFLGFCNS